MSSFSVYFARLLHHRLRYKRSGHRTMRRSWLVLCAHASSLQPSPSSFSFYIVYVPHKINPSCFLQCTYYICVCLSEEKGLFCVEEASWWSRGRINLFSRNLFCIFNVKILLWAINCLCLEQELQRKIRCWKRKEKQWFVSLNHLKKHNRNQRTNNSWNLLRIYTL